MEFRNDINGLRAYAVLAVIIFHFNPQILSGGFAGVDVFFVISGYLMTSIIFKRLESNTFSISKFYLARFKRIIPALLILILILLIFGYFFLAPISYIDLSKHSGSSLLFLSNFMYWNESSYFDAQSIEKILLHTWSLSVEWQFYILYPIVLLILSQTLKVQFLKKSIVIATASSLIFSIYASQRWSIAAYFLLPTRIWEMLLGSIAFLYPLKTMKQSKKYTLELFALSLILASFFIVSENNSWPGYATLIPTVGAFLLIQANNKSIFTNNIICQKLGLWSYSLYLYHWPLLAIFHKFNYQINICLFLSITLIFSYLSYYLVEKIKWSTSIISALLLITLISIYGIYQTNGASFRVNEPKYKLTAQEFHQQYYGGSKYPTSRELYINASHEDYDYFVFGDSFALQYANYFKSNRLKTRNWFDPGCLFFEHYHAMDRTQSDCQFAVSTLTKNFHDNHKPIIWMQAWNSYSIKSQKSNILINLQRDPDLYSSIIQSEIEYIIDKVILP